MKKLFIIVFALITLALPASADERRLALLIGNNDYPSDLGRLANTHEDVALVDLALSKVGFDVTRALDANSIEMEAAISAFETRIQQETQAGHEVIAFFYASMHGARLEVGGRDRNFLVPSKETIETPGQLVQKGFRLDRLLERFSASGAKAFFVISDACRNDLGRSFSRSSVKGFVPVSAAPGMLVAFATSEGATTPDDGLFASTLATEIVKPGRRATVAMLDTVEKVGIARSLEGQPYFRANRIPEDFCFSECSVSPNSQSLDAEQVLWDTAVEQDTEQAYLTYLNAYPIGRFARLANAKMKALSASAPVDTQDPPVLLDLNDFAGSWGVGVNNDCWGFPYQFSRAGMNFLWRWNSGSQTISVANSNPPTLDFGGEYFVMVGKNELSVIGKDGRQRCTLVRLR